MALAVVQHIRVSVSENLVQDVAELPAEDGATGKWQTNGVGPEGEGALLVVSAQNDAPGMLLLHGGLLGVDGFADADGLGLVELLALGLQAVARPAAQHPRRHALDAVHPAAAAARAPGPAPRD